MSDTITIPRAMLEQALEAIHLASSGNWRPVNALKAQASIAAIRAALERPQVEQEPVAWAVTQGGAICWEADYPFSNEPGWCDSDQQSVPLYTHPQTKRQPLTDDEINTIWRNSTHMTIVEVVRAIEAAHGI